MTVMRYMDADGGLWIAPEGSPLPEHGAVPLPAPWIREPEPGPCAGGMVHSFHPDPQMRLRQGFDTDGHPPNCPAGERNLRAEHALWAARPLGGRAKPVYVCPQCGVDERGADVHAREAHSLEDLGRQVTVSRRAIDGEPSDMQLVHLLERGAQDVPHARRAYYWLRDKHGDAAEVDVAGQREALLATGIDVVPPDAAPSAVTRRPIGELLDPLEELVRELRTTLRTSGRPNQAPDSGNVQVSPPPPADIAVDTLNPVPCTCQALPGQGHLLRCAVWP